ncbi:MAG: Rdx family protein [Candidatus Dormibacteria bacterium]
MPQAAGLAAELLEGWGPVVSRLEMIPAGGGRFEVTLDGELIFSKAALKRHAQPGEVAGLVAARIGPRIER